VPAPAGVNLHARGKKRLSEAAAKRIEQGKRPQKGKTRRLQKLAQIKWKRGKKNSNGE